MADGCLIFDTGIDPDGFKKGTAEISKNIGKLTGKLGVFQKEMGRAFNGSKTMDLQNKIKDTQDKISLLSRELAEMAGTQVKSNVFKSLERDIEKAKEKLKELDFQVDQIADAKAADLKSLGLEVDDDAFGEMLSKDAKWQKLQKQIEATEYKLEGYKQKLEEVEKAENSDATATIAYKKKENQLNSLQRKLESYKAKLNETENAENSAGQSTKVHGSSMKKATAQASGFAKSLKRIKRMLASMLLYKAVSAVFSGIKAGMENLAQASPEVNSNLSVLMSSLTRMKNALATAFSPILSVVTPILTKLINLISEAATYAGQFFAALTGANTYKKAVAVQENYANSLKSMEKQAKKTQKSLASFDSLNILTDNSDDTSSTAAEVVPETMFVDVKINSDITEFINKLKSGLKGAFSNIQEYLKKYQPSFSAWSSAFEKMKQPAIDAFNKVKASSDKLWNEGIKPFGTYLANDFAPTCVNAFSDAFASIAGDIGSLMFTEFANNFEFSVNFIVAEIIPRLTNAFDFIKTVWTDMMDSIKGAWDTYGGGIINGISGFCESMRELFNNLWVNFLAPLIDGIGNTISWLWDNHLKYLWDNIVNFFAGLMEAILTIWNNFLSPIVNWIVTVVGPLISSVINSIVSVIGTIIATISDVCSGIFKALTGLMDFITGVFSLDWEKAWGGIKKFFSGIWDAIWGIVKGVVNLIIDGLNLLWGAIYSVVAGIVNGIGGIAGALGSLFGQDWSFSMPEKPPLIPKLATGTVVPANYGEFLTVLGDNKREAEVVSPLSTMKQAFKEALAENGSGGSGTLQLNVMLDGSKIYSTVVKLNNANTRRTGKNALA